MATTSQYKATLTFTGDITQTQDASASPNQASPANEQLVNLVLGANVFAAPVGGGAVITRVTIIPPTANAVLITLKGVTGDTGLPLHKTDSTSLAVDTTFTGFTLTAAGAITGVRIIWS